MPELNLGKVVGPQGPQGATGATGAQGKQGVQGVPGEAGKSAYQAAKDGGYTGTEAEFNAILSRVMAFRRVLTSADDMNTIFEDGVYVYSTASRPANAPFENAAVILVFGADSTSTQKIQLAFRYGAVGQTAFRPLLGGTGWLEWYYPDKWTMDYIKNLPFTRRNLLDNAYFASIDDIIDQRRGYVLVRDATYYTDTALSTDPVTVDVYTTVYSVTVGASYTSFKLSTASDAVTYYAAPADVVRGYAFSRTSTRYNSIDRWYGFATFAGNAVTIERGCVWLHNLAKGKAVNLRQTIDNPKSFAGKTMTISSLVQGTGSVSIGIYVNGSNLNSMEPHTASAERFDLVSNTYQLPSEIDELAVRLSFVAGIVGDIGFSAVKLEIGSTQTLAHQDADGNWVLNGPPPDKALELMKCQKYYQLFSSADKMPTDKHDFRPELRIDATESNTGTIEIGGVTYHYADANL